MRSLDCVTKANLKLPVCFIQSSPILRTSQIVSHLSIEKNTYLLLFKIFIFLDFFFFGYMLFHEIATTCRDFFLLNTGSFFSTLYSGVCLKLFVSIEHGFIIFFIANVRICVEFASDQFIPHGGH